MVRSVEHERAGRRGTARALVQAAHAGPSIAVSTASALLALAADVAFATGALVVAAVLAGQLSVGWSNDLADRGRDARSARADKPLATGAVATRTVGLACGIAAVACLVLSFACGLLPGAVHVGLVTMAWAYNLGLKKTVWSWVPYAVAFGGLPVFVGHVDGATPFPWWVPTAGALLGVGAHFVNVVPDLADDAATGVRGLPHRLGARRSVAMAVGLLTSASVVVTVGPPTRDRPLPWIALGAVVLLAAVAVGGRGRTPFRAAIAIALVDVAVLAWAL